MTHIYTTCSCCVGGCCGLGMSMGLTGQSFPLTFDFGLATGLGGLDGDGDTLAPPTPCRGWARRGKRFETTG